MTEVDSNSPEARQFLTLGLAQEVFALPLEHVREIIEFAGLTPIPLMPDCLRGVINLRGAVVPVVDLASRLGRAPTQIGKRTCIVIVELAHDDAMQRVGMLVDTVNTVLEVAAADLQARPSFGGQIRADFIAGLLQHQEQYLLVLDVSQVLSLHELAALVAAPG